MLDILTIVHSFADIQTASRIRRTCRRLAVLEPDPIIYDNPDRNIEYEYRVGSKLHRLDGPARVCASGHISWYIGDIAHREYHPQIVASDYRGYTVEGRCHREAGPSIVSYGEDWYLRGNAHRKIGPAYNRGGGGGGVWYSLGKPHRLDGPIYGNIYAIRGVKHNISCIMFCGWVVGDVVIRRV